MVNRALEFFLQGPGVFGGDAGDEDPLLVRHEGCGDFHDLLGRFARAKNHFGETFPQRPVGVHLGETEVRHRGGLKRVQHLIATHAAGAKLFKELNGYSRRHARKLP